MPPQISFGFFAYSCISLIFIYAIHCFLKSFFIPMKQSVQKKYWTILSIYYAASTLSSLLFKNEITNLIVGFVCIIMLTLCFESKMYNRIIATVFINILGVGCEVATLFTFQFLSGDVLSPPTDSAKMMLMVIASKLILLFAVKILSPVFRLAHRKKQVIELREYPSLFFAYWFCVFAIPMTSLFVINSIFSMAIDLQGNIRVEALASVLIILVINSMVFYLYDKLIDAYVVKMENVLLSQQMELHIEQYQQMKKDEEILFELRHDLKNQMLGVLSCLESENPQNVENSRKSIIQIIGKIGNINRTIHTGVETVDSIINYKSVLASDVGAKIEVQSNLRENYPVDAQIICIILGNALDNAVEACRGLPEETVKTINICIMEVKRNFYLRIENPCNKRLVFKDGFPVTTKSEKLIHGIGLRSIDKVVNDYGGDMEIGVSEQIFTLEIILYDKRLVD